MRKVLLAMVCLVLLASVGLSCGKETEVEYTWKLSTFTLPGDPVTEAYQDFADLVKANSGGRMEIKIYTQGVLHQGPEIFDAVSEGNVDMGPSSVNYYFGKMPHTGSILSYMWSLNMTELIEIKKALVEDVPSMWNESATYNIMHILWQCGSAVEFMFDRSVTTMADMSGLKVRSFGGTGTKILGKLGASGVTLDLSLIYQQAQQDAIDGAAGNFDELFNYRIYEVLPYVVITNTMLAPYSTLMNRSSFEALPEDLQQVVLDAAAEVELQGIDDYQVRWASNIQTLQSTSGVDVYILPDAERTVWLNTAILPAMYENMEKYAPDDIATAQGIVDGIKAGS